MIARSSLIALMLMAVSTSSHCAATIAWPEPLLPSNVALQSVGEHLSINGMPVRIFEFSSSRAADELVAGFRTSIQRDYTRRAGSNSGEYLVAGRSGDFWLTLQVKAVPGGGVRGTWSASPRFVENAQHEVAKPPGFPPEATLIQQIDSFDVDKNSQLAVGSEEASIRGVADRLESTLRASGFHKEVWPAHNWTGEDRYAAVFTRSREQVVVTLARQGAGTAIVINRITALETLN
jgi:hypothetical protein